MQRAAESNLLALAGRAAAILSTVLLTVFGWQAAAALNSIQALQQQVAVTQTQVTGHTADIATLKGQVSDAMNSRAADRAEAATIKARLDAINPTLDRLERLVDLMKKSALHYDYFGG